MENPYDPITSTTLHDEFERSWYLGYLATQLISAAYGGAIFKSVTTSAEFSAITAQLIGKMDDIKTLLRASKAVRVSERVGILLVTKSGEGLEYLAEIIQDVNTGARKAHAKEGWEQIGFATRPKVRGHEPDFGDILSQTTPGDAANLIDSLDAGAIEKLFSINTIELDVKTMRQLRLNLVNLKAKGLSSSDLTNYINNIDRLKNVKGIKRVVKNVAGADDLGNFYGAAFEVEYAASKNIDDIIEIRMLTGGKPGDIDLIVRENNIIMGYELKSRNYAPTPKDMNEISVINNGFVKLVQEGTAKCPIGTINDHKIIFNGIPRDELIAWMNAEGIKWGYVVR
jgi:hypothetical protein